MVSTTPLHKAAVLPPKATGGSLILGDLQAFRENPLEAVQMWTREHGPIVRVRFGPMEQIVLTHPDYVRHVLQTNARNYTKEPLLVRVMRPVTGPAHEMLFTSEGDQWLGLRRLMQPAFHRHRIAHFAPMICEETCTVLARWRAAAAANRPIYLESEMMHLSMEVIARAMFSVDIGDDAEALKQAFTTTSMYVMKRVVRPVQLPLWVPLPWHRQVHAALATIERVLDRVVRERQASGQKYDDLLDMLIAATDPETGQGLTRDQLISEMSGIVFAGHETTAATLTWALYLLAEHPAARAKLEDELAQVLAGRLPTIDDLDQLTYTRQVIHESMRLYPPAWTTSRQAIEEDEVGGYRIPAGAHLFINIYGLHHHPEFWERPDEFDPDRFAPANAEQRPKLAFLPFGAGPRKCIGEGIAMLEAVLILATVAQQVRLQPRPGQVVEPETVFLLRTRNDIVMDVLPR